LHPSSIELGHLHTPSPTLVPSIPNIPLVESDLVPFQQLPKFFPKPTPPVTFLPPANYFRIEYAARTRILARACGGRADG
jgi:hypothetical protein